MWAFTAHINPYVNFAVKKISVTSFFVKGVIVQAETAANINLNIFIISTSTCYKKLTQRINIYEFVSWLKALNTNGLS